MRTLEIRPIAGASVRPGVPYQDIPGLCGGERNNSVVRANRIGELVSLRGKSVLDLGCNVGTISARLQELGAFVMGMDYDEDSIAIARKHNLGPQYLVKTIDLDLIRELPKYDVIVWVSQFMWLVKQKGMDHALDCLWEIGRHCDVLIFETAGKDDGSAPLDITQEEVIKLLCRNTIFTEIYDSGQWNDLWTPRNVFVCSKPLISHDGFFATVTPGKRGQAVKTFKDNDYARQLKERTATFLREMSNDVCFPDFISEDEMSVTMSWGGPKACLLSNDDIAQMLCAMNELGITHRDIRPDNLLFNGENAVLIDFSFAVRKGERSNASHDLGKPYRCPHGFNDEYSLMKCQQELLRRS